jgi:multiple sugar transport system permease protein/putative aldouronate transport system permease protein
MALPFLVLCFLFSYLPLYGWIYSLFDYRPPFKLFQCQFVGLKWITAIITNPVYRNAIGDVLKNTFAISGLNLLTSVLPLAFAVLLNEIKRGWFKRTVQILTTLPNFISWVLVYSVAYVFFSTGDGVVNKLLMNAGMITSPINFLASDNHTWLVMTLWSLWKFLGWNAIMYLAALAGIDQELYEAARVDGAGRFRMMWNITIPSLLPTFFVLLLLSVANFLNNGLDQYYVFQNAMNKAHIQVLDLYVYNIGMGSMNFPLATAISMLKSIISVALLFTVNGVSKLVRGETIV